MSRFRDRGVQTHQYLYYRRSDKESIIETNQLYRYSINAQIESILHLLR